MKSSSLRRQLCYDIAIAGKNVNWEVLAVRIPTYLSLLTMAISGLESGTNEFVCTLSIYANIYANIFTLKIENVVRPIFQQPTL